MDKVNIGILCPSDIAYRRFLPALARNTDFNYVGIAVADRQEWSGDDLGAYEFQKIRDAEMLKAQKISAQYGGDIFPSYADLLKSSQIDAVYIPLPPALHYRWAMQAVNNGKHVLQEKPFTSTLDNTLEIIGRAKEQNIALHENYMFMYHSQISFIDKLVSEDVIGKTRLFRMTFGFPKRPAGDFRYNRLLGGGALLDCGGYPVKLATHFLGSSVKISASKLNFVDEYEVDLYGSATLENEEGQIAQISFGMDNFYRCELEIWGSMGMIRALRIFTAGADFSPPIQIFHSDEQKNLNLEQDDQFFKSIDAFYGMIRSREKRDQEYQDIVVQAGLIQEIIDKAKLEK